MHCPLRPAVLLPAHSLPADSIASRIPMTDSAHVADSVNKADVKIGELITQVIANIIHHRIGHVIESVALYVAIWLKR